MNNRLNLPLGLSRTMCFSAVPTYCETEMCDLKEMSSYKSSGNPLVLQLIICIVKTRVVL